MAKVTFKLQGIQLHSEGEADIKENVIHFNGNPYEASKLPWDAPVSGTIYGTLLNYKGSLQRMGNTVHEPPYNEPPRAPILYIKPINTIICYGMPIPIPSDVTELEMGAALGVVIGKTANKVKEKEALEFVAGYTIVNDVTIPHDSVYRPAVKHKSIDGFCPVGPWIVQKDGINPDDLGIRVFVNQELKQENTTANLIRSVPRLITEITEFMTLNEGDVLLVGVPENPPIAKEGDHVRIEIDQIGHLENTIVNDDRWIAGVKF